MIPLGTTRSRLAPDHALIAPDSVVPAAIPGWTGATGITLASPAIGARFVQYLADLGPGASAGPPAPGVERFIYVLAGEVRLSIDPGRPGVEALGVGGYAFVPAGREARIEAAGAARLHVFEKRFEPIAGEAPPGPIVGRLSSVEGRPFLGDPDARLHVLLPDEPAFDMAVNVFTFAPGAALPMVEMHVMEHGLLMLGGRGIYRLNESWYPVAAGDAIWMAAYCPQWFAAIGKEPASYLYYKDVRRDPIGGPR